MTCLHIRNGDARRRALGMMPEDEATDFDEHEARCPDCRKEVARVSAETTKETR